ncbi:hypothetical protein B0H34DRAFT_795327 [Crassisporium funariophilum]|nr:hypothetical protein B0H34DRAFT_795327 [Crassisporium funariophilum]
MHAKYQRRFHRGERALIRELQPVENNAPVKQHEESTELPSEDDADRLEFTGPITITVVETLDPVSTSTSSTNTATLTSSSSKAQTTTTVTATLTNVPSNPPKFTFTPVPSVVTPTMSASGEANTTTVSQGSNSFTSMPLNSGAIAGIVIGCLIFIVIALFFGLRRKFKQNRRKLRGIWTRSRGVSIATGAAGTTGTSFEPKQYSGVTFPRYTMQSGQTSPGYQFAQAQGNALSIRVPATPVPVPPVSYNNDSPHTSSPSSTLPSAAFSPMVYSQGTAPLSPFAAMVVFTFIPSLPDELSIRVGETIRVLAEYDDEWVLCMNTRGEQGMVPNECLNRGGSSWGGMPPLQQRNREARLSRRVASLSPTLRAQSVKSNNS